MKHVIVAALLALSAGVALASDVTPYDKELAAQMLFPKKATPKQAAGTQKGATKEQGHADHANCVCAGFQTPLVPDYGG